MTAPGGPATTTPMAGHTRISARAMNRVVAAVASQALGVRSRQIAADIDDDGGRLSVIVRSPIRIAALRDIGDRPELVRRTGGTIIERAEKAQSTIHTDVERITGSTISRVEVRLTSAHLESESRVK